MQICDEAQILAERRGSDTITMKDLEEAVERITPSISPKILDAYKEYERGHGSRKKVSIKAPIVDRTMYG
jgi:Cdc6-like AAA superfamily ATPase